MGRCDGESAFPTTPGAFQRTYGGSNTDVFVTKLNLDGTGLVYSTYLGGSGDEQPRDMAVDQEGNAYIPGMTSSTNFPTTAGAFQTSYGGGNSDGFVAKLNPTGSALVYSIYLGGSGDDIVGGVRVDSSGNTYVPGQTSSTDFPTTADALQGTYGGGASDTFLVKLNPTGSRLLSWLFACAFMPWMVPGSLSLPDVSRWRVSGIGLCGSYIAAKSGFEAGPVAAMITGPKPLNASSSKVCWNCSAESRGQSRCATRTGRRIITAA